MAGNLSGSIGMETVCSGGKAGPPPDFPPDIERSLDAQAAYRPDRHLLEWKMRQRRIRIT